MHTCDPNGANLWIQAIGSSELAVRVAEGEIDPIQGWHSRGYGHKQPAPTVIYRAEGLGPIYLVSLLTAVIQEVEDPKLSLCFDEDSPAWGDRMLVNVVGPGFDDQVCMPNPDSLLLGRFPADALWIARGGEKIPIL